MGAARFVETFVRTYHTTEGCHYPWHFIITFHDYETLSSYTIISYTLLYIIIIIIIIIIITVLS
jgi:hypothetical protein